MQLNKKKNVNNLHKFIARQKIVLKAKSRKRERDPVIAKFYFVIKTLNWIILFKQKVKTTTLKHFMQNLFGVGKRKEFKPNPFLSFFIKTTKLVKIIPEIKNYSCKQATVIQGCNLRTFFFIRRINGLIWNDDDGKRKEDNEYFSFWHLTLVNRLNKAYIYRVCDMCMFFLRFLHFWINRMYRHSAMCTFKLVLSIAIHGVFSCRKLSN